MNNIVLRYRAFGAPLEQLKLEQQALPAIVGDQLRVAMSVVPVNPSDLIPVTGAYAHRITLPAVAGYEGIGVVVEAPPSHERLIGQRVLPLRGEGTWQRFVTCDPALAIPVPDDIDDFTAARAYINPLAALRLLQHWPVRGRRVLLTGAGSTCAHLLGLWAKALGAAEVTGIYRSDNRVPGMRNAGVQPLHVSEDGQVKRVASQADITFDALGGPVAGLILDAMRPGTTFVGYGLLTGKPVSPSRPPQARYRRFHLRDELETMSAEVWQQQFELLWPRLRDRVLPSPQCFPLEQWRQALGAFEQPGRNKPMIEFASN